MKKTSPIKSILSSLLVILTFISLSASSLRADQVVLATGSANPSGVNGYTDSGAGSTTGGFTGSASFVHSTATSPTANLGTTGCRDALATAAALAGLVDVKPWIQLAPTVTGNGGTYTVYITRGTDSSGGVDCVMNISTVNCISSSASSTTLFRANASVVNHWVPVTTVTLNAGSTTPIVKFTYHSGSCSRMLVDAFYFGQVTDGTGTADCTGINGSFSAGTALDTDTTLTVNGCSSSATDIIIKDTSNGNAVVGTVSGLTPGWGGGDQIVTVSLTGLANHILKAVQTIAGVTSRLSTAPSITVQAGATAPDLTSITTPVYSDAATVTANGVVSGATHVKIYDITAGGTLIGDATVSSPPSSVAVPVTGGLLVQGHTIKATQVVGANESSLVSAPSATVLGPICTTVANVGITSPVYDNATTVTVTGCDVTATTIKVYHGATLLGSHAGGAATEVVTVSALTAGWVITADQTVGGQEGCSSGAGVGSATVLPICASVANVAGPFSGPLNGGAATIIVNGVNASATTVKVYQGGILVGMAAGGATTVAVPVTGLTKGSILNATQVIGGQESCLSSAPSSTPVGSGSPKALRFAIGLRNTTGAIGPLGTDGGTLLGAISGPIYIVGGNNCNFGQYTGAPQNIPAKNIITASGNWQTLNFSWSGSGGSDLTWNGSSNVAGTPAGNASGGGTWAVLEGLYIVPDDATDTGEYKLYIDNVVNGTQGVLEDFEAAIVGDVDFTFDHPSLSGTTSNSLLIPPNTTVVTAAQADTFAQSEFVNFQFNSVNAGNWLRLTTFNAYGPTPFNGKGNPSVDITQPITMRVLLLPPTLNVSRPDATHLTFTWTGTDLLQSATDLINGPWTTLSPGTSPTTITIDPNTPQKFYRLKSP